MQERKHFPITAKLWTDAFANDGSDGILRSTRLACWDTPRGISFGDDRDYKIDFDSELDAFWQSPITPQNISYYTLGFDAVPWLRGAAVDDIVQVFDSGADEFTAFAIAEYSRDFFRQIDDILAFCERHSLPWHCRFTRIRARNWLRKHRPEVHQKVLPVMRQYREKRLEDDRTEGIEWDLRRL